MGTEREQRQEEQQPTDLERVVKELEFRTTVTTAMLGTLDLEQILYVILSGITSGDGLGFNRAFLFLTAETGRALPTTATNPQFKQWRAGKVTSLITEIQQAVKAVRPNAIVSPSLSALYCIGSSGYGAT